ncbi:hypothetical protein DB459_26630 [Bradyrhizobium sp. WD16]|nr:hypothetical protein DB459_26630 [Bradyrhizobium sp. WD16]
MDRPRRRPQPHTVVLRFTRRTQYSVSSQSGTAADALPFAIGTAYWFVRLKRAMTAEVMSAPRS